MANPQADYWTPSAVECYNRKKNCDNCPCQSIMETKCEMKKSVPFLLKKLGKPSKEIDKTFFSLLSSAKKDIVKLYIFEDKDEDYICKKLNMKKTVLTTHFSNMYVMFDTHLADRKRWAFKEWAKEHIMDSVYPL